MIKKISEDEVLSTFLSLVAEVECGDHFNITDPEHVEYIKRKINRYTNMGAEFYGYFSEDKQPIGFITLMENEHLAHLNDCEILEVGVMSDSRNRGYGSALLKYSEGIARKRNVYRIYVTTYAGDDRAIHFYGKNGYVPVAVIPDTNGPNDEGDIIMRKILVENTE